MGIEALASAALEKGAEVLSSVKDILPDKLIEEKLEALDVGGESKGFNPDKLLNSSEVVSNEPNEPTFNPDKLKEAAVQEDAVEQNKPNEKVDELGYKYTFDDQGRTVSVEGNLQPKSHEGRRPMEATIDEIGKGDQQPDDERGHLIADRFEGAANTDNLVPQSHEANMAFGRVEDVCAKAVADGKDVQYKVEAFYEGDSNRPSEFEITYRIDGEETHVVISNEGGER